jgi:apolipoprotein N-acyltransferase
MGGLFALTYALVMLVRLRLPPLVSGLLACSQTLVWMLFGVGAWKLWHLSFPLDVLSIACLGTALFWLEWTLLPLWGTAQNFSCSQPVNRLLIALTGATGGIWSLLFGATWFVEFITTSSRSHSFPFLFASTILLFGTFWRCKRLWFSSKHQPQTLRVAVFGWAGNAFDALTDIPAEFQTAARQASEGGARLLVTPEAAIHVEDRAHFRVSLCTLALKYDLALAVGYFDQKRNENCIDFINAQGEVVSRYVKTHLVPVFERYQKGRGEVALMEVDGIKVGGLVCQDDNFPDIARKYGKAGAQLLAIPTNDWRGVKDVHLANHRWRALENRFALARATSDGVSALTSFDGEIEKSSDHFKDGAQLLVADVSVGNGKPTLYARTGDWFPVACGVAALVGLWFAR